VATCFSEQIELTQILPACDTMLVVAMNAANDNDVENTCLFTYTLDAIKYCNGPNLLIRYCCDPAYSEVIVNNGVAVGASFSDTDGYCWTVVEETALSVTGIRTKATDYVDCTACTSANPCPNNYEVSSCCEVPQQIFVPVMPGVNVGESFVDTYGNCWYVDGTIANPITNVVYVDTAYPGEGCNFCTTNNPCPKFYTIVTCCEFRNQEPLGGYTTSTILGPGIGVNDVFIDQFGVCWKVKSQLEFAIFPNLAFITPDTNYINCETCITTNPCPLSVFYTLQNCCTQEIEIWESFDAYQVGNIISGSDGINNYCYKILSFDFVGPATLVGFSPFGNYQSCQDCINNVYGGQCPTP
jgi:hypothetical protein